MGAIFGRCSGTPAAPATAYTNYDSLNKLIAGGERSPIALVKLEYLLGLRRAGQAVPCRQNLPKEAVFRGTIGDDTLVLVMSYCWCTKEHPDPERKVLEEVCSFGEYLDESRHYDADMRFEEDRVCAHDRTIVVFWDYVSLYQRSKPISKAQEDSFRVGLADMNQLYAHNKTWVLLFTKAHRQPEYLESGWPFFEWCVSQLSKPADLTLDVPAALEWIKCTPAGPQHQKRRSVLFLRRACRRRARQLALIPEAFNQALERKEVTNGTDKKILMKKYSDTYQAVLTPTHELSLKDVPCADSLTWGTFMQNTLPMCKCLRRLDLSMNEAIESSLQPLTGLVQLVVLRVSLCVGLRGSLEPLKGLTRLEELYAYGCLRLSGGLGPLAGMKRLKLLDVEACSGLTGSVLVLKDLDQLTELRAGATGLEDLQAFAERRPVVKVGSDGTGRAQQDAAVSGSLVALRALLEDGADVDHADGWGAAPLLIAASQNQLKAVRLLLEARAAVGKANNAGITPLWAACNKGYSDAVQLLLEARADFEKATNRGDTPLITAAEEGHCAVVRQLLQAGASLEPVGSHQKTALGMAEAQGHAEVADLLR